MKLARPLIVATEFIKNSASRSLKPRVEDRQFLTFLEYVVSRRFAYLRLTHQPNPQFS